MIYRKLINTYILVLLILGIPLMITPNITLKLFGIDLNSVGASMSAFYGSSMLGVAWMMWKAKQAEQSEILEGLLQGNLIIWILPFILSIIGQIQSIYNQLGLTVAGLSVFFSAWYGYIPSDTTKGSNHRSLNFYDD